MQMISESQAGAARAGDGLTLLDHVALVDLDFTQMRVQGHEPEAVVNDHEVAVNTQIARIDDAAAVGGGHVGIAH